MKAEKSKRQLNTSRERESRKEKSEIDNETIVVEELPTKPRSIKPNNVPAALMILAIILVNLEVSKAEMSCPKASDIKWISKTTNKLVGCTPCQPCPSSQEFSIPCGTKAYVGTEAKCIPCPNGKFSDGFNTKPCVSCSRCSNRIVQQNCSLSRNSICGDCAPGYYLENTLFDCIKCAKCCHDGRDETHANCSLDNLCKVRPFGCPSIPTTKLVATSSISNTTTSSGKQNQTPWSLLKSINSSVKSDSGMMVVTRVVTTAAYENHSSTPHQQSTQNGFVNMQNPWIIVCVVILIALVIVLIIIVVILTIKFHKVKKSDKSVALESAEYNPVSQDPNLSLIEMEEDQTLEQFMDKNYDVIDKLSKLLLPKKLGMLDIKRLAMEWKLPKEDVEYITNDVHIVNASSFRVLLEVLRSQRLCTTVRQLADSIKKVNNEAYKILKPYLLKPKES